MDLWSIVDSLFGFLDTLGSADCDLSEVKRIIESLREGEPDYSEGAHLEIRERIEIEILTAEQVRVNRIPVAYADLSGVLTPLIANSAERGVLITCNKDVPHGSFVRVLDITKQCGTAEISVIER